MCSPAPQASEAERPARIPQLHRRMLGPAQPSNCLTYTHPNSSNSYLILSSLSTYYPLPCVLSLFSRVPLCAILCTVTCQAPLSVEFSRQEYWSGLPISPPGDLPDPGVKTPSPVSPALQVDSSLSEPSVCLYPNSLLSSVYQSLH